VALTAMRSYDNYTFTHMVNVSILAMGQARALGIEGRSLREFGLAALMHDIGKVRTPKEILQKPEALTEQEFAIMRRHPMEGAEILRCTPDMPILAPVVAFEHHLRLDGTGYPDGVQRSALNLGTMICSISDVYDAMRSQRVYRRRSRPIARSPCSSKTTVRTSRRISSAASCNSSESTLRARSSSCRRDRSAWSRASMRRIPIGRASSCSSARTAHATRPVRAQSLGSELRRIVRRQYRRPG
jgi:putative nucleotidyltransferase with HDIG domain